MKTIYGIIIALLAVSAASAENYYDHTGSYQGRMENGRFYDRNGSYQGRQENGRFYDKNGSYRGRKQ